MEAEEKEEILVLKDDLACLLKADLAKSVLFVTCKQHMESLELREKFMEMLQIANTYQLKYLLANVRAMHYIKLDDTNWLFDTVIPAMKESPLQKWARLEDPTSMMDINSLQLKSKLQKECGECVKFDSFLDEESALHWLLHEE